MTIEMRRLIQGCWRSPVFGDSFVSSMAYADFEQRVGDLERALVSSFTPIIVKGMPEISPQAHEVFVRALSLHAIGLFSNVGIELHNIDCLTRANVCFGLLFWAECFLDRGDPAMETALIALLDEYRAASTQVTSNFHTKNESKRFRRRRRHASESFSVQRRLDALRKIEEQIMLLSRPEDAFVLLHSEIFIGLMHSLEVRRLNRLYQKEMSSNFWKKHASTYVKHSILSMSLFGYIGLIYAIYRQETPDLPSLAEIMETPPLMRFVNGLANAAARIFDDIGDQELDAGVKQPHIGLADAPIQLSGNIGFLNSDVDAKQWAQVNLFNIHEPELILAFFHCLGETDEEIVGRAIAEFQKGTREGDSSVVQLFVDLLRQQLKALPIDILQRYSMFITLAKRCIETAYNNTMGDEAFGF